MANFTEMGNGMPNIFNFIPEAGKSGSGINDLAGLLALSKDGNNNDGWGGQWAVWLIFILAFCNGGFGGFGRNGFGVEFEDFNEHDWHYALNICYHLFKDLCKDDIQMCAKLTYLWLRDKAIPEGKAFYHYMKHLKHKHKEDRD